MTQLKEEVSTKEVLQQQLDKLKRNRDSVPLEEQKTKYKQAFKKLEQDIVVSVYTLMKETIFYYWCSESQRTPARNYFLELYKDSEVNSALNHYDADKVVSELERIKEILFSYLMKDIETIEYTNIRYTIDPFNPQKIVRQEDGNLIIVPDIENDES